MRGYEVFTNRVREMVTPAAKEPERSAVTVTLADAPATNRDFWLIRGLFLTIAAILGALEVYLNTVVFSGLVAVIGFAFSSICVLSLLFSTFLGRSPNAAVRRIARWTDAIGLGTSAAVCCVWFYGASSIQTAADRGKEWETASTEYKTAREKWSFDHQKATDDLNTCRARPVQLLPKEERAGALQECLDAFWASDYSVTVPDPGPRPGETEAVVAAQWKPRIRGLGIFGIILSVGSIGAMGIVIKVAAAPAVSAREQAAALARLRVSPVTQWPLLTQARLRQSRALATIKPSSLVRWPLITGEIFGPFYQQRPLIFCGRLVTVSPSPRSMAAALAKLPITGLKIPDEKAGKSELLKDRQSVAEYLSQTVAATESVNSKLSQTVAVVAATEPETVADCPLEADERKTTLICNGDYKLIPRTPSGWKLHDETVADKKARYKASITTKEGQRILSCDNEGQKAVVAEILIEKGKMEAPIEQGGRVLAMTNRKSR